jgi:hypothetical protein
MERVLQNYRITVLQRGYENRGKRQEKSPPKWAKLR